MWKWKNHPQWSADCPQNINTSSVGLSRTQRQNLNTRLTLPSPLDSRTAIRASCLWVNNRFKHDPFPLPEKLLTVHWNLLVSVSESTVKTGMQLPTPITWQVNSLFLKKSLAESPLLRILASILSSVSYALYFFEYIILVSHVNKGQKEKGI